MVFAGRDQTSEDSSDLGTIRRANLPFVPQGVQSGQGGDLDLHVRRQRASRWVVDSRRFPVFRRLRFRRPRSCRYLRKAPGPERPGWPAWDSPAEVAPKAGSRKSGAPSGSSGRRRRWERRPRANGVESDAFQRRSSPRPVGAGLFRDGRLMRGPDLHGRTIPRGSPCRPDSESTECGTPSTRQ